MSELKAKVRRAAVLGVVGLGVLALAGEALAQVVVVPPPPHRPRHVAPPPPRHVAPPPPRRVAPPPPRRVAPPPVVRRVPPPAVRFGPGRVILPALPLIVLPPLMAGYMVPPPPPPPVVSSQMVVAHVNTLNLRACPAANCQVIGVLQRGTPVVFLEYTNGWARVGVTGQDGVPIEGWVAYKYLAPLP